MCPSSINPASVGVYNTPCAETRFYNAQYPAGPLVTLNIAKYTMTLYWSLTTSLVSLWTSLRTTSGVAYKNIQVPYGCGTVFYGFLCLGLSIYVIPDQYTSFYLPLPTTLTSTFTATDSVTESITTSVTTSVTTSLTVSVVLSVITSVTEVVTKSVCEGTDGTITMYTTGSVEGISTGTDCFSLRLYI